MTKYNHINYIFYIANFVLLGSATSLGVPLLKLPQYLKTYSVGHISYSVTTPILCVHFFLQGQGVVLRVAAFLSKFANKENKLYNSKFTDYYMPFLGSVVKTKDPYFPACVCLSPLPPILHVLIGTVLNQSL